MNFFFNQYITYSNLFFYELPGVVDLLRRPTHCEHLYIGVGIGRRVALQLYSRAGLLAYAFNRLASYR